MLGGEGWDGMVELGFDGVDLGGEVGFVCFELGEAFEEGVGLDVGVFEGVCQAGDGAVDVGSLGGELIQFQVELLVVGGLVGVELVLDVDEVVGLDEGLAEGSQYGLVKWFG